MAVFSHDRTYGVELEVATVIAPQIIADEMSVEFLRRGIRNELGEVQTATYEGYHHETMYTWKIVKDVSISRGWELVSPPMKGINGKAQIEAVCAALKALDISVDRSCGLHVHHDARNLSGQAIGSVFALYAGHHDIINMMLAPSRRNSRWASPINHHEVEMAGGRNKFKADPQRLAMDKIQRNATRVAASRNHMSSRYVSLNIDSMYRQGTIEFRQSQGSVNAARIWNWVVFTQSFIEAGIEAKQFPAKSSFSSKGIFNSLYGRMRISANYNNGNPDSEIYVQTYKFMAKRFKFFCKNENIDSKTLQPLR